MSNREETVRSRRIERFDGLEVLQAHYRGYSFPKHFHDTYVVAFIEAGVEAFRTPRKSHEAPVGSVILLNPGDVHDGTGGSDGSWAYGALYPSVDLMREVLGSAQGSRQGAPEFDRAVVRDPTTFHEVRTLQSALLHNPERQETRDHLIEVLVGLVDRHAVAVPERTAGPAAKVVAELQHYMKDTVEENPSIDDLARVSGYSRFHLIRLFRRTVGITPGRYLMSLRIERARRLLLEGRAPADVAYRLRFADQSHFTRTFRRYLGTTPGVFATG